MIGASKENPWMERYLSVLCRDAIRQRTHLPGRPLRGLQEDFVEVACERMTLALEGVFIATTSICEIIQGEAERAIAYCLLSYPTAQIFLQRAYAPPAGREMYWPTCITGPAGTGKTELVKAIGRLFSGETEVFVDTKHGTFTHMSWRGPIALPSNLQWQLQKDRPEIGRSGS